MNFAFLIMYRHEQQTDVKQVLADLLMEILEKNLNEFSPEMIEGMIHIRHERLGSEYSNENGEIFRHTLFGFTLHLPEETEQLPTVINEFSEALLETPPILHAVKFEDSILQKELARWSEEIFLLEMKLRRVLTFIYLYANQTTDPYNLLCDETVQPMSKEKLMPEQMKAAIENQFFHLTFGQYVNLNKRPELKLSQLLTAIQDKVTYDDFRHELRRSPVQHEDDAVFIAGLKERMEAIEKMRNCIAHNRRPSKRVIENYENVRPLLDIMLDDYLSQWEFDLGTEMPWDLAAREAVENALEYAVWDDEAKTITFFDPDDDRLVTSVSNCKDLEQYLCEVAATAFYANAPRDDGEFVFECDEDSIVEDALSVHEDRLNKFFNSGEAV